MFYIIHILCNTILFISFRGCSLLSLNVMTKFFSLRKSNNIQNMKDAISRSSYAGTAIHIMCLNWKRPTKGSKADIILLCMVSYLVQHSVNTGGQNFLFFKKNTWLYNCGTRSVLLETTLIALKQLRWILVPLEGALTTTMGTSDLWQSEWLKMGLI